MDIAVSCGCQDSLQAECSWWQWISSDLYQFSSGHRFEESCVEVFREGGSTGYGDKDCYNLCPLLHLILLSPYRGLSFSCPEKLYCQATVILLDATCHCLSGAEAQNWWSLLLDAENMLYNELQTKSFLTALDASL